MALEIFANDGQATVTAGGTTAPAAGTTESWTLSGSSLPAVSSTAVPPTICYVADVAATPSLEKILVTNISGATATVTRGADGTTPIAHTAGFTIKQVVTRTSLVNSFQRAGMPVYFAADFGLKADGGVTDNGPIFNAALKSIWNNGAGAGIIMLGPSGFFGGGNTSYTCWNTIVIPPMCGIAGLGKQKTMIRLGSGANCDLIQFMQYNSASQATLLGVTATTLQNAFYSVIRGMTLHGSWNFQGNTDYHHGINAQPNPLLTTAGSDPDFDPFNLIDDVEVRYASGDGLFADGRSGLQVRDCLFRYNQGNGVTPSFDSLFSNLDVGFNGIAGVYQNHGSTSGDGKLYNNGNIPPWVSGAAYTAGNRVMSAGICYGCILATSGTTAPASDATHWTAIATTSPAAFGWDLYLDSNCYEARWDVDSQEPTAGSVYLKSAYGCTVEAVSNRPNFDNPVTGAQLATNPNSYACVTLDGANGCNVILGYSVLNGAAYPVRMINAATRCNVMVAGDGTGQAPVVLAGNYVVADGAVQSPLAAAQAITAGAVTLTFGATIAVNAAAGDHFRVTLTASTGTFGAPTNPVDGQKITFEVIQDATGSRTVAWNAAYDFGTPGAPVLTTTAAKRDLIGFVYSSSLSKWLYSGSTLGL